MQWFADLLIRGLSPDGLVAAAVLVLGVILPRKVRWAIGRGLRVALRNVRRYPAAFAALTALTICMTAGWLRMPIPVIHDERSNLLGADTFLHGRLANPQHPFRKHFEDFHVLTEPTYASKFLPAIPGVLAVGTLLGHPIFGMWIVMACAAAALTWALRAWMPATWSILGALLAVTHPLVFAWGQSYWGGSVAVLGSALLLGGIWRLTSSGTMRAQRRQSIAAVATGLLVLLCARPYESVSLLIAVLVAGIVVMGRRFGPALRSATLACVLGAVPAAAFLMYGNWRITGDPLLLPYERYERNYNPAPLFVWQAPQAPMRDAPPEMRRYYDDLARRAASQSSLRGWFDAARKKLESIADDLLRLTPTGVQWVPLWMLLPLPFVIARRREIGWSILTALLALCAILCVTWYAAYYLAVLFPILVLAWIACIRYVATLRVGVRRAGRTWSHALIACWVLASIVELRNWKTLPPIWNGAAQRQRIQEQLETLPGQDLVLVQYGTHHFVHLSWVSNAAEIDRAPVIWARSLSAMEDARLMENYRDRNVWHIAPDGAAKLTIVRRGSVQSFMRVRPGAALR